MPGTSKIGKIKIGADVLDALNSRHEHPPSGWMSVQQVADLLHCCTYSAARKLAALHRDGMLDRKMYIKGHGRLWYYDVSALKKR